VSTHPSDARRPAHPLPRHHGPTHPPPRPAPPCRCFPADAVVTLASGAPRRLRDLAVGDAVLAVDAAGALVYSEVYSVGHPFHTGRRTFKRLSTAAGANVTATGGHYMLVGRGAGAGAWAGRAAVPARDVRVGDVLWVVAGAGAGAKLEPSPVVAVADVVEEGMRNPFTLAGTAIVDGVAASIYVDLFGSDAHVHRITRQFRALWRAAPWVLRQAARVGWYPGVAVYVALEAWRRLGRAAPGAREALAAALLAAAAARVARAAARAAMGKA
jgi:hypothetical protein